MSQPDILQTARLTLRPLAADDASWIAAGLADPDVLQWLTQPPSPYSLTDAHEFLAFASATPEHRAILFQDRPCGVISLRRTNGPARELGFWLTKAVWGQGIMTEAVQAVLDAHWAVSKSPVISGWIPGNTGSAQIHAHLGFKPEGQIERWANFHGRKMPLERVRLKKRYRPLFTMRTARLRLNALTMEDLPVVHDGFGRPEVARMLSTIKPNWTHAEARAWLTGRIVGTRQGFGRAVRLLDGTLIGSVGMGGPSQDVGYFLAPHYWGQGYATEALSAFLQRASAHYDDITRFQASVFDDNPASARVLEKLGFRASGQTDSDRLGRVEPAPATLYRVDARDLQRVS
ncbi:MAG: GNAT family N-acetyltransferase [Pseudomonadota bacterium]